MRPPEKCISKHIPDDIELAFSLLKNCLLRRADELSTPSSRILQLVANVPKRS